MYIFCRITPDDFRRHSEQIIELFPTEIVVCFIYLLLLFSLNFNLLIFTLLINLLCFNLLLFFQYLQYSPILFPVLFIYVILYFIWNRILGIFQEKRKLLELIVQYSLKESYMINTQN